MKKILLIGLSFAALSISAQELSSSSDYSIGGIVTKNGAGILVNNSTTYGDGEEEVKTLNKFEVIPVEVTKGEFSKASKKLDIDISPVVEKKSFIDPQDGKPTVYLKNKYQLLDFTHDGVNSSARLLNAGVGTGVQFDLGEDTKLSVEVGSAVGTEFGKRPGILDLEVYAQSDLNVDDMFYILGRIQNRGNLNNDLELTKELFVGANVSDHIRLGVQVQKIENTFSDSDESYDTQYGGLFIAGKFGKSK